MPKEWKLKEARDKLEVVMKYLKEEESIFIEHCGEDDDVSLPEVRAMIRTLKEAMDLLE
jgi:hypothetical protein